MSRTNSSDLSNSLKKISKAYKEPAQSLIYTTKTRYEIPLSDEEKKAIKAHRRRSDGWFPIESFDHLISKIESELAETKTQKPQVQTNPGYNHNYSNTQYTNYQQSQPYNYYYGTYAYNYPRYNYNTNQGANNQALNSYVPKAPQLSSLKIKKEDSFKKCGSSRKESKSRERSRKSSNIIKTKEFKVDSSPNTTRPTEKTPTPLLNTTNSSNSRNSTNSMNPCDFDSKIEESIRKSTKPIPSKEVEIIEINGIRGIWLNKEEVENWKGEIPLSQYEINVDPEPELVKLKHSECLEQTKQLSIKYFKPPKLEEPGPIVIKQEPNYLPPPAPPIIIRQIPDGPINPKPITIREKPPVLPEPISSKTVVIPGKRLPPPPRRLIIEKIAPAPPELPKVTVERWLPFEKRQRRVVFEKCENVCPEKPKNLVLEWEPQCVIEKTVLSDLGVEEADPVYYNAKYKDSLKSKEELPKFALEAKQIEHPNPDIELVGDIEALKLIDLEREGLNEYKKYVKY